VGGGLWVASAAQVRAWHEKTASLCFLVPGTNLRIWSEGRERERTPERPDGEAVPPKCRGWVKKADTPVLGAEGS